MNGSREPGAPASFPSLRARANARTGGVNLGTILRFQFGEAKAIREVAESRSAAGVGVVLVFTAAIARNYDQKFVLESPWIIGPLVVSLISALFIYGFIRGCCLWVIYPKAEPVGFWSQFRRFLPLFWMTAPLAWLYAIPVERFLDPLASAKANLALLAVVALWRVVLLARVLSVLHGVAWPLLLLWVIAPACVEVVAISVLGGPMVERRIMAGMAGIQLPDEEQFMMHAASVAANGAFIVGAMAFLSALGLQRWMRLKHGLEARLLPAPALGGAPWKALGVVVVVWIAVAIYPQVEVRRHFQLERLMKAKDYRGALACLSRHERGNFAPSRLLAPDPYSFRGMMSLENLAGAADGSEAEWVRVHLLDRCRIVLGHKFRSVPEYELLALLRALPKIRGANEWAMANATALRRAVTEAGERAGDDGDDLRKALATLGVSLKETP